VPQFLQCVRRCSLWRRKPSGTLRGWLDEMMKMTWPPLFFPFLFSWSCTGPLFLTRGPPPPPFVLFFLRESLTQSLSGPELCPSSSFFFGLVFSSILSGAVQGELSFPLDPPFPDARLLASDWRQVFFVLQFSSLLIFS